MFAFVKVRFTFSLQCQDTGWEECFRNDLFCVGRDTKS